MNDNNFHPEMLTLARNSRGMTKGRLADLVDVSGTAIGRLEAGTLTMTNTVLERICDALDYGSSFFLRNPVLIGQVGGAIFHRKQQSLPVRKLYRAHALAEVRRLEFMAMTRSLDDVDRLLPEYPVDLYDDDPEAIARSVRAVMNLPPGPIFNLTQVLERNGCVVVSHDFQSRQIDGFSQRDQYPPGFIHLNADLPPDRWRWTLAHELGHYVFADEYSTDWDIYGAPSRTESRIDRFARAVLLPSSALAERWHGGAGIRTDAVRIASEFRVDMSTLARRLEELRLAGPEETATVRATRTRRADIVEFDLVVAHELAPPHLPEVYVKAVLNAYRREEISAARALGLLLDTWAEDDLPALPLLPAEATWSFVT